MRVTQVVKSGMPSERGYMGWWGEMGGPKQKGIVTYSMSPFRQRPFKGVFQSYLFNGFTRIMSQVPYWIIPIGVAYGAYTWGNTKYAYYNSKQGHHEQAQKEGGHGGH